MMKKQVNLYGPSWLVGWLVGWLVATTLPFPIDDSFAWRNSTETRQTD